MEFFFMMMILVIYLNLIRFDRQYKVRRGGCCLGKQPNETNEPPNKINFTIEALELHASCGFPGKPYRAKINPEEKLTYEDGQTISYECSDFWAPPQVRKCVNGVWVGPVARCGNSITNVLMKDVQLSDVTYGRPIEKFHYREMNLTSGTWKFPNSFASKRFHEPLIVIGNHEHLWRINFTKPAVKMFVKVDFNFINYTLLNPNIKKNLTFHIEVEISSYRSCQLMFQNHNSWSNNGNRIDSFFICEAYSYEDLQRDIENPGQHMTIRTKSSHYMHYQLFGLFLGRVYGNETEPFCGEPETDFGQSFRANQEFRDYYIYCISKEWADVTPILQFTYSQRCIGDMIWNGTRPRCVPLKTCPLDELLHIDREKYIEQDDNCEEKLENPLILDSIQRYYNFIDNQTIYAVPGTEITYACSSTDHILAGKDTRTCKRDTTWSGVEPVCKYIKSTDGSVLTSPKTLIMIIVLMGVLLLIILTVSCFLVVYCVRKFQINHQKNSQANNQKPTDETNKNPLWHTENYYDNIELNNNNNRKILFENLNDVERHSYDIYEPVDNNNQEYRHYSKMNFQFYDENLQHQLKRQQLLQQQQIDDPSSYFIKIHSNGQIDENVNDNHNINHNIVDEEEHDYIRMVEHVPTNSGSNKRIDFDKNKEFFIRNVGGVRLNDTKTFTGTVLREPSYLEVNE